MLSRSSAVLVALAFPPLVACRSSEAPTREPVAAPAPPSASAIAPGAGAKASPHRLDGWWSRGDAACPTGAHVSRDPSAEGDPQILCVLPDGTPHGPATLFYPGSDAREMEGEYLHGKPQGRFTQWDREGRVTQVGDAVPR